ncbi:MAG: hypothetical protein ABJF15_17030, partial [Rhodopirellula bahusiensis]
DAAKAADKTFAKRGRMMLVVRWGSGGESPRFRESDDSANQGENNQCSATKPPAAEFTKIPDGVDRGRFGFQLRRLSRLRHPTGLRTLKKFPVSGCQRPERVAAESGMKHNPA